MVGDAFELRVDETKKRRTPWSCRVRGVLDRMAEGECVRDRRDPLDAFCDEYAVIRCKSLEPFGDAAVLEVGTDVQVRDVLSRRLQQELDRLRDPRTHGSEGEGEEPMPADVDGSRRVRVGRDDQGTEIGSRRTRRRAGTPGMQREEQRVRSWMPDGNEPGEVVRRALVPERGRNIVGE